MSSSKYLIIILIVAAILLFWKSGQRGINEWDEARDGVNATEMYRNGDLLTLYYDGQPDTWNVKPPLFIWTIDASYHLFGLNAFALRLPALLFILCFFVFAWLMIRRYDGWRTAIITLLILLSSKAVLGIHTGLTADFDAPLLCFMTAAVYFFLRYTVDHWRPAIYWSALMLGLSFYTKGTAAFICLPSFLLFGSLYTGGLKWMRDKHLWLSFFLFLLICSSWVVLSQWAHPITTAGHFGKRSPFNTMVVIDTWTRMTTPHFDHGPAPDRAFIFSALDVRFNIWNYLFYAGVVFGMAKLFKTGHWLKALRERPMVLLAPCIILPLALLLTLAANKHDWYLAPAFLFFAFCTAKAIDLFISRYPAGVWAGLLLFLFLFIRHFAYIDSLTEPANPLFNFNDQTRNDYSIIAPENTRQDVRLQLEWTNRNIAHEPLSKMPVHGVLIVRDSADASFAVEQPVKRSWYYQGYYYGYLE